MNIFQPPILFALEVNYIGKWDKKELVLIVDSNVVRSIGKKGTSRKISCNEIRFGRRKPQVDK